MMPESSKGTVAQTQQNDEGLDYFGYYKHRILELFSQEIDFLSPSSSKDLEHTRKSTKRMRKDTSKHNSSNGGTCNGSALPFSGKEGLSDVRTESIKTILQKSVIALNQEVEGISHCVGAVNRIKRHLRDEEQASGHSTVSDEDVSKHLPRKQMCSTPISEDIQQLVGTIDLESYAQVRKDFQELLESGGSQAEKALVKYSDDLLTKLRHMEQHIEDYVDTVMSKFRQMTLTEKQQLRQRIKKLPQKSLDRVVEIIQRRKRLDREPCTEIDIDLDKEDNITLWRLHFYAEMIAKENELPP